MAGFYDDTLAVAADAVFLLPNMEYVTYIPASGSQRRIKALVERHDEGDNINRISPTARPEPTVLVKNSTTDGISSGEINTGGDKMEVALRDRNKPITVRITELISHDAGWCKLAVQ